MNIAFASHGFARPGGTETYALTVSEQLQRLGHEVVILAGETGPMADFAIERGHRVTTQISSLDGWIESALVQDPVLSYRLAERFPEVPQLFRASSDLYDLSLPPGLPGLVSSVVVCNDRVKKRIQAMAGTYQIHRLRQPVDTERFNPAGEPPARPRRALLLGNYLRGDRLEMLRAGLEQLGIVATQAGGTSEYTFSPEQLIWQADLVVALGRAAVEGMACGKPVFLYDKFGGDGWVTPDRYPAMEADNFMGQSRQVIGGPEQLRAQLEEYRPEMGLANRELAITYHGARAHTHELCALLESAPRPDDLTGAPLHELSRLARVQWLTELRAHAFQEASRHAHEELERERAHHRGLEDELSRIQGFLGTRRVRLGVHAGRVLDALRKEIGFR